MLDRGGDFLEDVTGIPDDSPGGSGGSFGQPGPPGRRIDKLEGYPTAEEFGQHFPPEVAQEFWTKLRQHLDWRESEFDEQVPCLLGCANASLVCRQSSKHLKHGILVKLSTL